MYLYYLGSWVVLVNCLVDGESLEVIGMIDDESLGDIYYWV